MAHLLEALRVVVRGGHPHETTVRRSAQGPHDASAPRGSRVVRRSWISMMAS